MSTGDNTLCYADLVAVAERLRTAAVVHYRAPRLVSHRPSAELTRTEIITAMRAMGWDLTDEPAPMMTFEPAAPQPVKAKNFDEWLAETSALLEECGRKRL